MKKSEMRRADVPERGFLFRQDQWPLQTERLAWNRFSSSSVDSISRATSRFLKMES